MVNNVIVVSVETIETEHSRTVPLCVTDWFGNSIKYIDGYPDYRGAGAVFQTVNIGRFTNRSTTQGTVPCVEI